jgi:hypothetical protein
MAILEILYDKNDMLLELTGLKDEVDATFINNAAVAVTLTDEITGAQITGAAQPIGLTYVAASNGDYRAVLPAALDLTPGLAVRADLTVDAGAKGKARFEPLLAVKRRALS